MVLRVIKNKQIIKRVKKFSSSPLHLELYGVYCHVQKLNGRMQELIQGVEFKIKFNEHCK